MFAVYPVLHLTHIGFSGSWGDHKKNKIEALVSLITILCEQYLNLSSSTNKNKWQKILYKKPKNS